MKNVCVNVNYITEEEKYSTLKRNFAQERAKEKKKPLSQILTGIGMLILSVISIPILNGDTTFALLCAFFGIGAIFGKEDK